MDKLLGNQYYLPLTHPPVQMNLLDIMGMIHLSDASFPSLYESNQSLLSVLAKQKLVSVDTQSLKTIFGTVIIMTGVIQNLMMGY